MFHIQRLQERKKLECPPLHMVQKGGKGTHLIPGRDPWGLHVTYNKLRTFILSCLIDGRRKARELAVAATMCAPVPQARLAQAPTLHLQLDPTQVRDGLRK